MDFYLYQDYKTHHDYYYKILYTYIKYNYHYIKIYLLDIIYIILDKF